MKPHIRRSHPPGSHLGAVPRSTNCSDLLALSLRIVDLGERERARGLKRRGRYCTSMSRSSRLRILPVGVARQLGQEHHLARNLFLARKVFAHIVLDGFLGELGFFLQHDEGPQPGAPQSGSSTPPSAVASTTSGCPLMRSSTSAGKTFSPPETIISSSRPLTNSKPL